MTQMCIMHMALHAEQSAMPRGRQKKRALLFNSHGFVPFFFTLDLFIFNNFCSAHIWEPTFGQCSNSY